MKSFLLLMLISIPSFAAECPAPGISSPIPQAIVDVMDAVEQKAVTETQMNNAFCKTFEVPEYDWWLENQVSEKRINRTVKGFNFKDQSEDLINAFSDIVKNMPAKNSSCTNVLCAVDEIWGKETGRKILYIRARHGYNTSELAFENTMQLSSSQLNDILITLGDLPPEMEMIGRGKNQRMTLELPGVLYEKDPEASADSTIKFYDPWKKSGEFRRRYGLFHEFGHNVSFDRGNLDSTNEWKNMPSCPVSKYGEETKGEDFAESFLMYRYNGPGLKQKCPAKYEYLRKNAYNQKEFLNGNCY